MANPPEKRIRVLVVDDHPMMRDGIASTLRAQADMELAGEASNGKEALEQYARLQPDVVLLDLNMPEMNGLEAPKSMCASFANVRVVVLTTNKGDALANREQIGVIDRDDLLEPHAGRVGPAQRHRFARSQDRSACRP